MPQIEMLRKIGDTLGVLGLGELRAQVQEATRSLEGMVGAGRRRSGRAGAGRGDADQGRGSPRGAAGRLILPKQALPKEGEEADQTSSRYRRGTA